jgi:enterochelin esterase-like enzyme
VTDWLERFATFYPDPYNPSQIIYPKDEEIDDSYSGICSIVQRSVQLPAKTTVMEEMQTGRLEQYRLYSAILHNERRIWTYTPPGYDMSRAQPYDLLLLFDGFDYAHVITPPPMLDTLLATSQIPPLVAVFIDNLGQKVRNKELPCYQPFIEFLIQELMPWIHNHYHITRDPQRTIISGSSYGGLAAAFAGLQASNVFGNILAQSGAFWWKPDDEEEYEWIIQQFEQASRLPLRFSLQAGQWEPILPSIRHMRDVLCEKGYPVHYHEYYGGHDDLAWHTLFPLALQELVNDWQR